MKRLLPILALLLFPLLALGQLMPLQRNFFTTNVNPLVTVAAGSNATVQASTVGVNQRVFTVNGVPGVGQTQWSIYDVTNSLYLTNWASVPTNAMLSTNGGTVFNPIYDDSGLTTAPTSNQLVTASWVRRIFDVGASYYNTTNIFIGSTNADSQNQFVYEYHSTIPISDGRAYLSTDFLTNGGYVGAVCTTNTFASLSGPIVVNAYFGFIGGAGGPTLTMKPELYISYDRTNWFNELTPQFQTITHNTTNLYQWIVDFPAYTSTNSTGFYLQRRYKVGTITGVGARTLWVLIGTNAVSGIADASHITMQSPTATAGNAYLANNQTFTGSNAFTQTIGGNASTATSATNWTMITNTAAAGQVPVATSATTAKWDTPTSGTGSSNIVDSGEVAIIRSALITNGITATNAVFWNAAGTRYVSNNANGLGIDAGAPAGKRLYVSGDAQVTGTITTGDTVTSGGGIISGTSSHLSWNGRSRIYSPASGSIYMTDSTQSKDRFYVNGPVKALTDETATSIAQINIFTNSTKKSAFVGGVVDYTIFGTESEGGDSQVLSGIVTFSAANTNGVFYDRKATEVSANQAKSVTAGTLTASWALVDLAGKESTNIVLQVTPDTSLTFPAGSLYILWQLRSNGTNTVTAL